VPPRNVDVTSNTLRLNGSTAREGCFDRQPEEASAWFYRRCIGRGTYNAGVGCITGAGLKPHPAAKHRSVPGCPPQSAGAPGGRHQNGCLEGTRSIGMASLVCLVPSDDPGGRKNGSGEAVIRTMEVGKSSREPKWRYRPESISQSTPRGRKPARRAGAAFSGRRTPSLNASCAYPSPGRAERPSQPFARRPRPFPLASRSLVPWRFACESKGE
jgi:hypothetical protein